MSKRFIDTGIFDDDWFMDLSKDGKLLWIYLITKCDHAGMIKINSKLFKFHTGISDVNETLKELGKSLVTVNDSLLFIPKYISFQYPGFPRSNVKQQDGALKILRSYNLINEDGLTLNQVLPKTYDNVSDNVSVIKETWRENFEIYKSELRIAFDKLRIDKEWISQMQKYHPGVDILKTLEKTCVLFWSTEAGWKNKKSKKIKTIDWKHTLTNAMDQKSNRVFLPFNNPNQPQPTPTPKNRFEVSNKLEKEEREYNDRTPEQKEMDKRAGIITKLRILYRATIEQHNDDVVYEMHQKGELKL